MDDLASGVLRADWPFEEPVSWQGIQAASEQLDPAAAWAQPDFAAAGARARAGFLGSVCGCVLGKPVEVDPTLFELETAGLFAVVLCQQCPRRGRRYQLHLAGHAVAGDSGCELSS